jgi:hypothetical protein
MIMANLVNLCTSGSFIAIGGQNRAFKVKRVHVLADEAALKTTMWMQGSQWNQSLLSMQECAKFSRQVKAKGRIVCADMGVHVQSF